MDLPDPLPAPQPDPSGPYRWALLAGLGTALLGTALVVLGTISFDALRQRVVREGSRYRASVLEQHLRADVNFSGQIHRLGGRPEDDQDLRLVPLRPGQPRLLHPTWRFRDSDGPELMVPLSDRRTLLLLQPNDIAGILLDGTSPDLLKMFSMGLRTLPGERVIGGDAFTFQQEGNARRTVRLQGTPILEVAIAPRPLPLSVYAAPLLVVAALTVSGATAGFLLSRSRNRQLQHRQHLIRDRASLLWLTHQSATRPFRWPTRPEGPAMQAYFASGQALLLPGHSPAVLSSGSSRRLYDELLFWVHPEDRHQIAFPDFPSPPEPDPIPRAWSARVRLRQPDGSWRWHELRGQTVFEAPLEIVQGVLVDVDEQVRNQQHLSERNALLALITDQGGVWPYRFPLPQEATETPDLSPQEQADLLLPQLDPPLLSLGKPDLLLQHLLSRVHPEDHPIVSRHHQRLRQASLHSRQECSYRLRLPGRSRWLTVLDRAEVVQELPRRVIQGVLLDLDERERLQQHERQLWTRVQTTQATIESVTRLGGLFFLDYPLLAWQDSGRCAPDDFTLSHTCLEFLDLPAGVTLQDWMQRLQARIHPADLTRVQAHYAQLPADPEQPREQRFRMQLPQGGYTIILCRSRLHPSDAGWRIQGVGFALGSAEQSLEAVSRLQQWQHNESG